MNIIFEMLIILFKKFYSKLRTVYPLFSQMKVTLEIIEIISFTLFYIILAGKGIIYFNIYFITD